MTQGHSIVGYSLLIQTVFCCNLICNRLISTSVLSYHVCRNLWQSDSKSQLYHQGPLYWYGLTSIPAWTSNYMISIVWDEINYPFPKVNSAAVSAPPNVEFWAKNHQCNGPRVAIYYCRWYFWLSLGPQLPAPQIPGLPLLTDSSADPWQLPLTGYIQLLSSLNALTYFT